VAILRTPPAGVTGVLAAMDGDITPPAPLVAGADNDLRCKYKRICGNLSKSLPPIGP
jgi:hypothetical protein